MTVLDLFVGAGVPETKVYEIFNGQNKTPADEADASKKGMMTCPKCGKTVKMKPVDFVYMGCNKCGNRIGG